MSGPRQPPGPGLAERFLGSLLGLACGDAIGTTVEFSPRGTFAPLTGMTGGGPFALRAGEWTDDTAMALCLAASLVERQGCDPHDQMARYCRWQREGYMSSNGRCFDIGLTVARALERYRRDGKPYAGDSDPRTAGNGALMRLAPVVMFYSGSPAEAVRRAEESTRTTHAAPEAIECSALFGRQLQAALAGGAKAEILAAAGPESFSPKVRAIADAAYRTKARAEIRGSGYCVAALEAALWCFAQTDSFAQAVLMAANLGDDADTTAAICGQLAGAHYGAAAIPAAWREQLARREEIEQLALALAASPFALPS